MSTFPRNEGLSHDSSISLPLCMENALLNRFTGEVLLPSEVTPSMQPIERSLVDMKTVFYDPDLLTTSHDPQKIVHRIYRYIGDTEAIIQAGIKYDITVILPGDWGLQLPTTTGHYHLPIEPNKSASPDFYQLLHGEALAILQRETDTGTEVKLLRPQPGEWMLFPPTYAHSVVNIGREPAVFANICVRKPHLNYEPILNNRGMAYYVLREGSGYKLEQNPNYKRVLRAEESRSALRLPDLDDVSIGAPFYWLATQRIEALRFLAEPDRFPEIFDPEPIESVK